jgi:hypothetical protein
MWAEAQNAEAQEDKDARGDRRLFSMSDDIIMDSPVVDFTWNDLDGRSVFGKWVSEVEKVRLGQIIGSVDGQTKQFTFWGDEKPLTFLNAFALGRLT